MARRTLILALILTISIAHAQEDINPKNIGRAELELTLSGRVSGGSYTLFIPRDDTRQSVQDLQALFGSSTDKYGNRKTTVNGNYELSFLIVVNSNRIHITENPDMPITISEDMDEYLEESKYIYPDVPGTKLLAEQIMQDSKTELEAIAALANWVHDNVEYTYTPTYVDSIKSSTETLQNKKGVCDEFTNVYTALARAVGIPTRVASGFAYTGSEWQPHAWAESYVPGEDWVPIDATFGEAGLMDALHVKLYHGPEYLSETYVSKIRPTREVPIEILETQEFAVPKYKVSGEPSDKKVAPNQKFTATLRIENEDSDDYRLATYTIHTTEEITILGSGTKATVVFPRQEERVQWGLLSPLSASKGYVYYHPIIIDGPNANSLEINITVDPEMVSPGTQTAVSIQASSTKITQDGSSLEIEVEVGNQGTMPINSLKVSLNSEQLGSLEQNIALGRAERRTVTFSFPIESGVKSGEIYLFTMKASLANGQQQVLAEKSLRVNIEGSSQALEPRTSTILENPLGEQEQQTFLNQVMQNILLYLPPILIVLFILLAIIFLAPSWLRHKASPFEEKGEWDRLMSMDSSKKRRREKKEEGNTLKGRR
jgi:hypothetical protein